MMVGLNIRDSERKSFVEFDRDMDKSGKDLDVEMDETVN
jgi:hypothetical protein